MSVARVVDRVANVVSSVSTALSTLAVLWLMVTTVTHVALRQSGRPGLAGIVESNALVMVGVVFLGLAGAQRAGTHVAVRLFLTRMPPRVQSVLSAAGKLLALVLVLWLLWSTSRSLGMSFSAGERLAGVVPLPLWPARAVLVFGLAGLLLEVVNGLLKDLFGSRDTRPSEPAGAIPEG